jgi:hypothetical protein
MPRMLSGVTWWLFCLPFRLRSFATRNTCCKYLTPHISRGISQEGRQRELLGTTRTTFFIHGHVKWVGMLCWNIELGGCVNVGGTSSEKFASLNYHRAAVCAPEVTANYSASCGRLINFLHLRQPQIILPAAAA